MQMQSKDLAWARVQVRVAFALGVARRLSLVRCKYMATGCRLARQSFPRPLTHQLKLGRTSASASRMYSCSYIEARLRKAGLEIDKGTSADGDGPDHFMLKDPDGNLIMFDQHVPRSGGAS